MTAGQFSMRHNSVNQNQCSKYFKAIFSAGYFHSKTKFSTPVILESELLKIKKTPSHKQIYI